MLIFSSIKLGSIHSHVSHGEIYLTASFGLAILTDRDSTSICMHYIQSVLTLKQRMSKFTGLSHPSAGFRKLLAVLLLIVLSESRCGFFTSTSFSPSLSLPLSDEAAFDHNAQDIVFLKHPALREAISDQASFSVSPLHCRIHKRMFFFSFSWPIQQEFQSDEADMFCSRN